MAETFQGLPMLIGGDFYTTSYAEDRPGSLGGQDGIRRFLGVYIGVRSSRDGSSKLSVYVEELCQPNAHVSSGQISMLCGDVGKVSYGRRSSIRQANV